MITTANEIYEFTELAVKKCRERGYDSVAQELADAMHLGSSGLEILGAIRAVLVNQATTLEKVVDKATMEEIVRYVNRAFGAE